MKLSELSLVYQRSAQALRLRIWELRYELARQEAPGGRLELARRIAELEPLLREMRELAAVTGRYYERGYRKDERYTL